MKDTAPNRIKLAYEKTAPAEQSEAITTHQIVTSVLILSLAQATESQALTSNSSNTTKQPLQRKSVFPLVEIGVIGNTFNTFGVVQLLVPDIHRLYRRLFVFKSFGLGGTLEDIATMWH